MLRRLLLLIVAMALPSLAFAQSVTTSTGAPSRPAVVIVPSTGPSFPANNGVNAQATGLVILDPSTGVARGSAANPIFTSASGGGGGGAVYGPTAVGSNAANPPVLTGGTTNGTATGPVSVQKCAAGLCSVSVDNPLPAGSNAIGSITNTSFGATQATASALNATVVGTGAFSVQNTAATPAGANIIGKVGIDQTTPGTTNLVWMPGFIGFTDTTGSLAASTNSTVTQHASQSWQNYYGCRGYIAAASTGATLQIYETIAGGTSVVVSSVVFPGTAPFTADLTVRLRGLSTVTYGCSIANGTTAQTDARAASSFTTN